jgi:hypothetical protein
MQIYIYRDGQQYGPYPIGEAREHMAAGTLSPDDLAWHEGATEWLPLTQVVEAAEAAGSPLAEPVHEPAHEFEPEHAYHPVRDPEPEPAPAKSTQPSWVPPRRDAMSTAASSFAQSVRVPGASPFATPSPARSQAPAPLRTTPASAAVSPAISEPPVRPATRKRASSDSGFHPYRARAIRNLLVGGLFFFVGLVVTVVTYQEAAQRPGGGTYFVAWGAILFGGIQFVSGIIMFFKD